MSARTQSINSLVNAGLIFLMTLMSGCASTGGNVAVIDSEKQGGPQRTEQPQTQEPQNREPSTGKVQVPVIAPPRSSAAQTLLARANTALRDDAPATAIVLLERAVRIEPREAQLWMRLSKAHLDKGETQIALQHARKAIALAGTDRNKQTGAWLQLANVYEAQGRESDALSIRRRYGRGSG